MMFSYLQSTSQQHQQQKQQQQQQNMFSYCIFILVPLLTFGYGLTDNTMCIGDLVKKNCAVSFYKNDSGYEFCWQNVRNDKCIQIVGGLQNLQDVANKLTNHTILLYENYEESWLEAVLKSTHKKIDMELFDLKQKNTYQADLCSSAETKSTIQAFYKLNKRMHTDCKILIAEKDTRGECLANGLAAAMLKDSPFLCLEVFLFKISETVFKEIELRMKGFGNMKKVFYIFTNPLMSMEILSYKNIELIKNNSIWIIKSSENQYKGEVLDLQLLTFKYQKMIIFEPISRRTEKLNLSEYAKIWSFRDPQEAKKIVQISTLLGKNFKPLFNVLRKESGSDDVVLERSLNSPDVNFVDPLVEENHYIMATLIDPPLVMHNFDKYNNETNTCDRGHVLCSISKVGKNATKSCCYGYMVDLLEHFTERLNFHFTLKTVEDGKYGSYDFEKKTYNGMIGEVSSGNADFALHAIGITYKRANYVDFTGPFIKSDVSFLLPKRMQTYDYLTFSFISHISSNAIYAVICLYIGTIILLYVFDNTVNYFKTLSETKNEAVKKRNRSVSIKDIFSYYVFNDCFLYMGGLVFQRGIGGKAPGTFSGKFMAQSFACAMVIVTTVYTATLTAHAVTQQDGDIFLGFKDNRMLNPTSRFKFAVLRSSSLEEFFKHSKNQDFVDMYNFMEKYNPKSLREGVTNVGEGHLQAYIIETLFGSYLRSTLNLCQLKLQKSSIDEFGYGMAVPKGSTLKETFSEVILALEGSGELKKLKEKWFRDSCQNSGKSLSKFSLLLFAMPFLLLGGAGLLSGFLMVMEIIAWKIKNTEIKNTREDKTEEGEQDSMLHHK